MELFLREEQRAGYRCGRRLHAPIFPAESPIMCVRPTLKILFERGATRSVTGKRLALAALVLELAIFWLGRSIIRSTSNDVYWWLWSVAPLPAGVERPQRPTS